MHFIFEPFSKKCQPCVLGTAVVCAVKGGGPHLHLGALLLMLLLLSLCTDFLLTGCLFSKTHKTFAWLEMALLARSCMALHEATLLAVRTKRSLVPLSSFIFLLCLILVLEFWTHKVAGTIPGTKSRMLSSKHSFLLCILEAMTGFCQPEH